MTPKNTLAKLVLGLLFSIVFVTPHVWADEALEQAAKEATPHHLIEVTTDRLLEVVKEAQSYVKDDPDRYYQAISNLLNPVVDFQSFARSVMGPYGSKQRYESLNDEEKQVFNQQLDEFAKVFTDGLVQTYGKGILVFSGEKIEVLPFKAEDEQRGNVYVTQLIHGKDGAVYTVRYKFRKNDGAWKMRNVVIEGVNVGKIYYDQFNSMARQYNGDLHKVSQNWLDSAATEVAKTE